MKTGRRSKFASVAYNFASGFTLLEVMVVLVIISLVSTLVMQGFQFTLNLQSRLTKQLVQFQYRELQEQWFREVVRGYKQTPGSDDADFSGDGKQISGISLGSFSGYSGVPLRAEWRLEDSDGGQALKYVSDSGLEVIIATWPFSDLRFQYLDREGHIQSRWPSEKEARHLPKGVMLVSDEESFGISWYVSVSNTAPPPIDFAQFE